MIIFPWLIWAVLGHVEHTYQPVLAELLCEAAQAIQSTDTSLAEVCYRIHHKLIFFWSLMLNEDTEAACKFSNVSHTSSAPACEQRCLVIGAQAHLLLARVSTITTHARFWCLYRYDYDDGDVNGEDMMTMMMLMMLMMSLMMLMLMLMAMVLGVCWTTPVILQQKGLQKCAASGISSTEVLRKIQDHQHGDAPAFDAVLLQAHLHPRWHRTFARQNLQQRITWCIFSIFLGWFLWWW